MAVFTPTTRPRVSTSGPPELPGLMGAECCTMFSIRRPSWLRIDRPTLVCVGELEAGTPVEASREIANALPPDLCRFEILPGAGHFPWLDDPHRYFALVDDFVDAVATGRP